MALDEIWRWREVSYYIYLSIWALYFYICKGNDHVRLTQTTPDNTCKTMECQYILHGLIFVQWYLIRREKKSKCSCKYVCLLLRRFVHPANIITAGVKRLVSIDLKNFYISENFIKGSWFWKFVITMIFLRPSQTLIVRSFTRNIMYHYIFGHKLSVVWLVGCMFGFSFTII